MVPPALRPSLVVIAAVASVALLDPVPGAQQGFSPAGQTGPTAWAAFHPGLGAPACAAVGRNCDSGDLLIGRGIMTGGVELNQPNNLNGACPDGSDGIFHQSNSVDRIRVSTDDGSMLSAGKNVSVDVAVWTTANEPSLDIYYTRDIASPSPTWTLISSGSVASFGQSVRTVGYTLPVGGNRQAVRAHLRGFSPPSTCTPGPTNDTDDLVFRVRPPVVHLSSDETSDAFIYKTATGVWARQISLFGGGFQSANGGWAPGWTVHAGLFDGNRLTDFFLFSQTTGQWFKMLGNLAAFTTQSNGFWWPGWQRFVADLDGDGLTDVFLYDPISGQWFKCIATPTGFTYLVGGWMPGFSVYPINLNDDAKLDFFLFNRTTGQWAWALNAGGANFTYPVWGGWATDWQIYPGDFNGDAFSDLLLHRPTTGEYYVATTIPTGFTYVASGWSVGWTPTVVDWDADNVADLFLYNQTTGDWVQLLGNGTGHFTTVGTNRWSPSWEIHPTDFNGDGRADLLLYNATTGQNFQAWNLSLGSFAYFGGAWDVGLKIVAGPVVR